MTYKKRRRTDIMVINEFLVLAAGICIGGLLMAAADIIDARNNKKIKK